jgi:two-component system response regulator MtrA
MHGKEINRNDGSKEKTRILVVDDDPELLRIVGRTLELEGFDVTTASDGKTALTLLPECRPHLVVLDVMMPDLDGYETLELIRKQSDVPVLMLTALSNTSSLEKSVDLGADRYVTKPFRTGELVARIRSLLRRTSQP